MTDEYEQPDRYIYNPQTHLLDPYTDNPGQTTVSVEELTNGRVVLAGTLLWDTQQKIAVGDIKPTVDNIFTVYPSGHIEHYVPVDVSEINNRYYTRAGYAVGASIDALGPDARQYHFDLDYSKVAPPGRFLYVRNPNDWKEGYRWVEYIPGMADTIMDQNGDLWNKASQEEAIGFMTRGLIFGKYGEMLQEMVDNGLEDEFGNRIETVSGAAAFLVRTNMQSIIAARFTYIAGG